MITLNLIVIIFIQLHQISLVGSQEKLEVWIYLLHKYKSHMKDLPFLESYESEGDHGLAYVKRYLRPTPGPEYWSDVKQN